MGFVLGGGSGYDSGMVSGAASKFVQFVFDCRLTNMAKNSKIKKERGDLVWAI